MVSRSDFDTDYDFVGSELVERAKQIDGIAPEDIRTLGYGSNPKVSKYQTSFRSVYIRVDEYDSFAEFYAGLPASIRQLVTLSFYENDIVKLQQDLDRYDSSTVSFTPSTTPQVEQYIDQILSYIQHIYSTPLVRKQDFISGDPPIKQETKTTLKISDAVLKEADGKIGRIFIRQLLDIANLAVSDFTYIGGDDTDNPYRYEATIGLEYYEGIHDDVPEINCNEFVTQFLYTQKLYCDNCDAYSIIQPRVVQNDYPYLCIQCNTEYTHPDVTQDEQGGPHVQQLLRNNSPSAFIDLFSEELEVVEQQTTIDLATKFNDQIEENKSVLVKHSSDRAIVFDFAEDGLIAHIFSAGVYIRTAVSNTAYMESQVPSSYVYPCLVCGKNRVIDYSFESKYGTIGLWLPSKRTPDRIGIHLSPLCPACLDRLTTDIEQILFENVNPATIFTHSV